MKYKLIALLFVTVLITSVGTALFHPQKAAAISINNQPITFTFIDDATIQVKMGSITENFIDVGPGDSLANYAPQSGTAFCNTAGALDKYWGVTLVNSLTAANSTRNPIPANLTLGITDAQGQCNGVINTAITVANPSSAALNSLWWDGSNIVTPPGVTNPNATYTPAATGIYVNNGVGLCPDVIVLNPTTRTSVGTLYHISQSGASIPANISRAINSTGPSATLCSKISKGTTVHILGTKGKSLPGSSSTPGSGPGGSTTPSCDSGGFWSFNWIFCDMYTGISATADSLFTNVIEPELKTNSICLTSSSGANCSTGIAVYDIWSNIRIYGDIFLVIVLLIIVFGESLNIGLVDAYTAKKLLPRLLAAAILINLSIYIAAFMIDITNVVGGGIGEILTAPLKGAGHFVIKPASITTGGATLFGGLLLLTVANIPGIVLLLAGLALTGIIAVLGVLVTLVIRQAIIIGLVILAPVAFALWCLPNTEKWFKRWWDTFFQMLLVYPMVVVAFAVADILSYLVGSGETNNPLNAIVAFILVVIPLFMIPFMLRSSSRLLGQIQGAVGGVGQRINGFTGKRLTANANQEFGKTWQKTKNYERFSNRNPITRGLNTAIGATLNPRNAIRGKAGIDAGKLAARKQQGEISAKDDAMIQAMEGDDMALMALTNMGLAQQKLKEAEDNHLEAVNKGDTVKAANYQAEIDGRKRGMAMASQVSSRNSASTRLRALNSLAKTGFQFSSGEKGYQELKDSVRSIVGNDEGAIGAAMNEAQYNLRTASRYDLGGINNGAGYDPAAGVGKASLYELANAKKESIEAMVETAGAGPAGEKHAVVYQELQGMLPNSKGAIRDAIQEQIDGLRSRGVEQYMATPTGSGVRVKQRVNYDSTNPTHQAWNQEDRQRGYIIQERDETFADTLTGVRTYERPDPNKI